MLVLTRKIKEAVVIGGGVVVRVEKIKGNRVSLSFTAPDHVSILREELVTRMESDDGAICNTE